MIDKKETTPSCKWSKKEDNSYDTGCGSNLWFSEDSKLKGDICPVCKKGVMCGYVENKEKI